MSGSLVLEASAGTGKTYSIERLVLGALTEENPLSFREILVVTFTKAAARELKERIRSLLIERLSDPLASPKLKEALVEFDQAPIFTLHGFCKRILDEEGISSPEAFEKQALIDLVEGVLRSEEAMREFSPADWEILLKAHRQSPSLLIEALVKHLEEGVAFEPPLPSDEAWEALQPLLRRLDAEELYSLPGYFKGGANLKPELLSSLPKMTKEEFFEHSSEILRQLKCCVPKERLKKGAEVSLPLAAHLHETLLPLVRRLAGYPVLFLRLLSICRRHFDARVQDEGPLTYNGLVTTLLGRIENDRTLKEKLKERFKFILIDEFQDTDPLQWRLFQELFLDGAHRLVLVGDPKQSIYGFRGADIYTYIKAVEAMPEGCIKTLGTNYRSTPALVSALNVFFQLARNWIPLPRTSGELPYKPVTAGKEPHELLPFPLQCLWIQDEAHLFPYAAKEMIRLHLEHKVPFAEMAVLVRTHAQGKLFLDYLTGCGIPAEAAKGFSLKDSEVVPELIDILEALLLPRNLKRVKRALCGTWMGWKAEELAQAEEKEAFLVLLVRFIQAKEQAEREGVVNALHTLLLKERERLLRQSGGEIFYRHAIEILNWGLSRGAESAEEFLSLLRLEMENEAVLEEGAQAGGVQIATLHACKGLEYRIVFLPGLHERNSVCDGLVSTRSDRGQSLTILYSGDPEHDAYLEEEDAEKSRLLYVAMTRAKERLYLPLRREKKAPSFGKASPIELFMARSEKPDGNGKELYSFMNEGAWQNFLNRLKAIPEVQCVEIEPEERPQFSCESRNQPLVPPASLLLSYPDLYQFSFTSLAKPIAGDKKSPGDDEIPTGRESGLLLHELFEKLPWSLAQSSSSLSCFEPFLDKHLKGTRFYPFLKQFSAIFYHAFHTPLPHAGFCLKEVREEGVFREMEFFYDAALVDKEGIVRGVVDLAFFHEEKLYLLDWKSNWLPDYGEECLRGEMERHDYLLQEEIYRKALQSYLKLTGRQAGAYGGSYYLFLRGLSEGKGILRIGREEA